MNTLLFVAILFVLSTQSVEAQDFVCKLKYHFFRPEDILEAVFILREEPIKIMEQHPVENRTFRMKGAVSSCLSIQEHPYA